MARDYFADETVKAGYDFLKANGAKEVFLFGSRFNGDFSSSSDIDFGVKGFPADRYFSAIVDLEYATKLRVDLVDFDEQSDFFEHLSKTNSLVKLGA